MEEIKCKYIFDDAYNPKYVNGAQGGISPQGEIVVNFYLERSALPNSQTFSFDGKNLGDDDIAAEPKDLKNSFVRVIENGVVMNYQTAKAIHKWLGEHIVKLENIQK